MKNYGRKLALVAALAGIKSFAAPFAAVGDNAELFLTASAAVRFDDNIYLDSANEKSDTILSFMPGVDFVFGKNAATSGNIYYREEFLKYLDNDDQDTSLSNIGINSNYSNGKTKFGFGASYAQVAQNTFDTRGTGTIARRAVTNVHGTSEFGLSEKTSFGLGASYDKIDYKSNTFADSEVFTVPLDVYYEFSPKLDWSLGYRYRTTDLSKGVGSDDHFFNVGARGEFTPKLTGQVRVGYVKRKFDTGGDDDQFGIDSSVAYAISEKTSLQLGLTNDFSVSALGESTKTTVYSAGVNAKVSEQWGWNVNGSYRSTSYPNRDEGYFDSTAGVSYIYNAYVNFTASYTYRNNSSDFATSEFTNNVFSLGANVRY